MNWQTEVILMLLAEAVYLCSAFGAWGFCYLFYKEIKQDVIGRVVVSRAQQKKSLHVRWGIRNELLYIFMLFLIVVTPLLNTYVTIRLYQGRGRWKKKGG